MTLQYSRVERLPDGFLVDPRPYIDALPGMKASLPDGAYKFATDPEHYDSLSERSIKDLRIERLSVVDNFAVLTIELDLAYNRLPNVPRLAIRYNDVTDLSVKVRSGFQIPADWIHDGTKRLGDILTDEVRPNAQGCIHVIEMIHGAISITCKDLEASWS